LYKQREEVGRMILTLDISPETAQRVERAKSQGANMETLLCLALEHWLSVTEAKDTAAPCALVLLAGKYEGEAWDELRVEIEKNRK
jgi:hypothetical protein